MRVLFRRFCVLNIENGFIRYTSSSTISAANKTFLDTSLLQVQHDMDTQLESNKLPNIKTKILVNSLLHSLMVTDINKSRQLLLKLAGNINPQYIKNADTKSRFSPLNSYYSCVLLLFTNLTTHENVSLRVVKQIIEDYQLNDKRIGKITGIPQDIRHTKRDLEYQMLTCLIISYKNVDNSKIIKHSIAKYIKTILQTHKINLQDYVAQLKNHDLSYQFQEICKIIKIKFKIDSVSKFDTTDANLVNLAQIELYKDSNGFISLDRLCEYILETKFLESDKKMYHYYDELKPESQKSFMEEYLEFNKLKQVNVEKHCLDLAGNLDPDHVKTRSMIRQAKVLRFKSMQSTTVYNWYKDYARYLFVTLKKIDSSQLDQLDQDEQVLARYYVYLKLISKETIATLIVSNILATTISGKKDYVVFSSLVRTLSHSFTRILWEGAANFTPRRKQLLQFFDSEEDGLILFSTLVKKFIEITELQLSSKGLQALEEMSTLNNQLIQPPFLKMKLNSNFPAFLHSLISVEDKKQLGVVRIHPFLLVEFQALHSFALNKSMYLPMLCPPKKWISPEEGGYLQDLKPLVVSEDQRTTMKYMNQAHVSGQLNSTYSSLDSLSSVAWAINSNVFDVVKQVMDYDNGYMSIPPKIAHLDMTNEDYHDMKSLRLYYNLINCVASCFDACGDVFYLPHNVDFRGRAYPMVSVLSHYQEDLVRSIMMYWYSEPLGPDGLDWVKYQLAGVYGEDKLGFQERIKFVDDNIGEILDSANKPLNGNKWWKNGEKPWQTLALCMEMNLILKFQESGGNVVNYRSRIPIHQDGSCNGLQHYAALGADFNGGKSVNLVPIDGGATRGDVYTTVLEEVREKVLVDCDKEVNGSSRIAILASSVLSRKVVKQTVMTTVYGVTLYGASTQISDRISDLIKDYEANSIVDSERINSIKENQTKISNYIAKLVLGSISELFAGAKLIQDWLVDNAVRVMVSFDSSTAQFIESKILKGEPMNFTTNPLLFKPMMWTTLSGFPIVQVYRNRTEKQIPTALQSITIKKPTEISGIRRAKQLNAIAPNFIHSIDALHMLMTCTQARRENVSFVSVHDSYWTYPHTATKLSSILREEFIRLHSSEIIESLRQDLCYTTRKSYQLVWVEKSKNPEFVNELRELRKTYPIGEVPKRERITHILSHEMEIQSRGDVVSPLALLERYNVPLYFSYGGDFLQLYSTKKTERSTLRKLQRLKYTPLLVPVKILECPSKGDLDITQVRDSPYFFS